MTSATLVERISTARFFGERKIHIDPPDIYAAADDAQRELCVECELLQKRIQLALIQGQESYSFDAKTVTSVAQAPGSEGVLTIGANDFQVGDMVHVANVGGDCDGEQIVSARTATSITLQGTSSPPSSYSGSNGRVFHYLTAMVRPIGRIGALISSTGAKSRIHRIGSQAAEQLAIEEFSDAGKPINYELVFGSSPEVRILPTPDANYTLKMMVYRKPFPSQSISDSVDPILDSEYDRALYHGTLFFAISQFKREPGADRYIAEARAEFDAAKGQATLTRSRREFTVDEDPDYLRAP